MSIKLKWACIFITFELFVTITAEIGHFTGDSILQALLLFYQAIPRHF